MLRSCSPASFRLVHNLKGTCGFLNLARLEAVAHAAEAMLGKLRDRTVAVTPAAIRLLLQAVDRIGQILGALANHAVELDGNDTALIAALAGEPPLPAATAGDQPLAAKTAAGPVVPSLPVPARRQDPPVQPGQTVRVPVSLLEQLATVLADLAMTRDQLLRAASRAGGGPELRRPLQRLDRITGELLEGVRKSRMQPIGTGWSRLPRLVRELARALAKEIELEMRGGEIEADRELVEMIMDPLTHMVRNAADHGLEPPAERRRLGKPVKGRIGLEAAREGDQLIIKVSDDGRGLDTRRIAERAVARDLVTAADIAAMSNTDIQRFVLHPGLSTAPTVTPGSGQGVGMDVTRATLEKCGGSIEIQSKAGHGSVFTIRVPLLRWRGRTLQPNAIDADRGRQVVPGAARSPAAANRMASLASSGFATASLKKIGARARRSNAGAATCLSPARRSKGRPRAERRRAGCRRSSQHRSARAVASGRCG